MALQIPIAGVGIDWRLPGGYAEILFNQGAASANAPGRDCVIVMPKTSAGTWTVNTRYEVPNVGVAEIGAGVGSPAHRAARKFRKHNQTSKLYAVVYSATSGGSPATATGTVVITGPSTAPGTLTTIVAGEACSASYAGSSVTATTIGAALADSINAKTWLPVTALNSSGTVTITAKIAGASQGTATLRAITLHTEITAGTGIAATTSTHVGAVTPGADGSTTEAANLTTALAVLDSVRHYYMGVSVMDSTGIGALKTHIVNKSAPRRGLRSRGFAFYPGSLANAQTLAISLNYERVSLGWMPNPEHDPAEMVGTLLAIFQAAEEVHKAYNFDGYSLSGIISPAYSTADWPTAEDQNDAINDGLLPLSSSATATSLVMATTTRSKDSSGTTDDPRSLEPHRVSVADEFADEELAEWRLNYSNKRLADDELLANGKVNPNQRERTGVIRPSTFKPHIRKRLEDFESRELLQNIPASQASLRVVKTGARLEVGCDLNAIDLAHQMSIRLAEVSQG